ncbi:MAG TPA: D-mannonate oxidoreductase, partial [Atlantibacter hermannii]|nr:D-mannonate oxidoreductase [Atlantibacter hermannii]
GWMRYVDGVDEQGNAIEISDPLKADIAAKVAQSEQGTARVQALLSLTAIFGDDLPGNPVFVEGVMQAYRVLLEKGAKAAIAQYAAAL